MIRVTGQDARRCLEPEEWRRSMKAEALSAPGNVLTRIDGGRLFLLHCGEKSPRYAQEAGRREGYGKHG